MGDNVITLFIIFVICHKVNKSTDSLLKNMPVKYQNGQAVCVQEHKPIAFNPWKHHCGFVCNQIQLIREEGGIKLDHFLGYIGGTLLDFYIGELPVYTIVNEVNKYFMDMGVANVGDFKHWLGLPETTFKNIYLSDGSRWVMRLGQNDEYYIHMHPGRYSKLTIRCRPTTLKVAIAFRYLFGFEEECFEIDKVNYARKLAGLPPVESLNSASALQNFISNLRVNNR